MEKSCKPAGQSGVNVSSAAFSNKEKEDNKAGRFPSNSFKLL